jgi:hypothetical protein
VCVCVCYFLGTKGCVGVMFGSRANHQKTASKCLSSVEKVISPSGAGRNETASSLPRWTRKTSGKVTDRISIVLD